MNAQQRKRSYARQFPNTNMSKKTKQMEPQLLQSFWTPSQPEPVQQQPKTLERVCTTKCEWHLQLWWRPELLLRLWRPVLPPQLQQRHPTPDMVFFQSQKSRLTSAALASSVTLRAALTKENLVEPTVNNMLGYLCYFFRCYSLCFGSGSRP